MIRSAILALATLVFSANAFATYVVVLKNGAQYKAKAKWTVSNGKALVHLESGQVLQLDPNEIDVAKSEQTTRLGYANARVLDLNTQLPVDSAPSQKQPSLGDAVRLRKQSGGPAGSTPAPPATAAAAPASAAPAVGKGLLRDQAVEKFDRAYENVGIFGNTVKATGPNSLRADLTADNEDKVFNALSATSFLMVRNAGVDGVQIDLAEIYIKTTTGGSGGRFKMTRADAEMLDKKQMTIQEYFVRHVIY